MNVERRSFMKSETHFVDHVSLRLKAQKMLQLLRVIVATLFLLLSCAESIKKYIMLRMIFKRGLCLK